MCNILLFSKQPSKGSPSHELANTGCSVPLGAQGGQLTDPPGSLPKATEREGRKGHERTLHSFHGEGQGFLAEWTFWRGISQGRAFQILLPVRQPPHF